MKTNNITLCALSSAIICIFSVLSIPAGPVPITLGLFSVVFCGCLLSARLSIISVIIYILLGLSGLPVFSGFRGGIHTLAGPTGGYIVSYLAIAPISNFFFHIGEKRNCALKYIAYIGGAILLLIACYLLAVIHFSFIMSCGIKQAIAECVLPFVFFDTIKAVSAFCIAESVKKKIIYKG